MRPPFVEVHFEFVVRDHRLSFRHVTSISSRVRSELVDEAIQPFLVGLIVLDLEYGPSASVGRVRLDETEFRGWCEVRDDCQHVE